MSAFIQQNPPVQLSPLNSNPFTNCMIPRNLEFFQQWFFQQHRSFCIVGTKKNFGVVFELCGVSKFTILNAGMTLSVPLAGTCRGRMLWRWGSRTRLWRTSKGTSSEQRSDFRLHCARAGPDFRPRGWVEDQSLLLCDEYRHVPKRT